MARSIPTQEVLPATINDQALGQASAALTLQGQQAEKLMKAYQVTSANPDVLESEIRGYQQSAVEALFAIGARLLVLRTLTVTGDWLQRLERLSMVPRTAQRIMQATVKFGEREKFHSLGRGKLIELLALDDETLDVLEQGGDVLELSLDEFADKSTSELRKIARELKHAAAAKDKLLKKRGEQIDQLQEQLERPFVPAPNSLAQTEREQAQYLALQEAHAGALATLARLAVVVRDIRMEGDSDALHQAADDAFKHTAKALMEIGTEHGIELDLEEDVQPAWLRGADIPTAKGRRA